MAEAPAKMRHEMAAGHPLRNSQETHGFLPARWPHKRCRFRNPNQRNGLSLMVQNELVAIENRPPQILQVRQPVHARWGYAWPLPGATAFRCNAVIVSVCVSAYGISSLLGAQSGQIQVIDLVDRRKPRIVRPPDPGTFPFRPSWLAASMSPLNIINVCGIEPLKVLAWPPSSVPKLMTNCWSHFTLAACRSSVAAAGLLGAGGGEHRFIQLLGRHLADVEVAELRLLAKRRIVVAVDLIESTRQGIRLAEHDPANQLLEIVAVVGIAMRGRSRRPSSRATPDWTADCADPCRRSAW